MTIAVVQSIATNGGGGGAAGTWTSTFGAGATAGNTLFLVVFAYNGAGAAITSGSPVYNGSSYPSATVIKSALSFQTNVYCGIWMFPALASGGGTTLGATVANGTIDGNVGSIAYEVSGLGASPAVDQSSAGNSNTANITSGSTGAITQAPEFVIGSAVGFAINQTAASGFTNLWNNSGTGFCEAGYQIPVSSGGTYAYATNTGITAGAWGAAIATVYAAAAAAQPGRSLITSQAVKRAAYY